MTATRESKRDHDSGRSTGMMSSVAGLLLLTLLVRICVVIADGERLRGDPDAYVRLATMLADGRGFAAADGTQPTAFRPVLYPLLLSVPLKLGASPAATVAGWNLLAGLVLVAATVKLAEELDLDRRWTLIAGLLVAFDPLLIRYTTEPMTENVCSAMLTTALVFLLRCSRQARQTSSRFGIGTAAVAGILLGMTILCRPVVFVSCVLLTLAMTFVQWQASRGRTGTDPRRLLFVWIPALVAAVTVSPWIIRNLVQLRAFIPATTHGGYTLLLGNNSEFYSRVVSGDRRAWDLASLAAWQRGLQERLQQAGLEQAGEPAVDRWMYQQARREISQQPLMAARAVLLRWRRFWALTPTVSGRDLPWFVLYAVGTWYGALGIGLLASLFRLRGNPDVLLLWTSIASFLVVHSFYWTNTRMRAPLTAVLVVLAVLGWTRVLASWNVRSFRDPHAQTAAGAR